MTFDFGPGRSPTARCRSRRRRRSTRSGATASRPPPRRRPPTSTAAATTPCAADFVAAAGATFEVELGAGDYTVSLIAGDAAAATTTAITAERWRRCSPTRRPRARTSRCRSRSRSSTARLTLEFAGDAPAAQRAHDHAHAGAGRRRDPTVYLTGDSTVQTYDRRLRAAGRLGPDDRPVPRRRRRGRQPRHRRALVEELHQPGPSRRGAARGQARRLPVRAVRPQRRHPGRRRPLRRPADYEEYLRVYVEGARQRGAHARARHAGVAAQLRRGDRDVQRLVPRVRREDDRAGHRGGRPLVDLSASSRAYLDEIGPEAAKAVFLHVDPGSTRTGRPARSTTRTSRSTARSRWPASSPRTSRTSTIPLAGEVVDVEPPAEVPGRAGGPGRRQRLERGATLHWDAERGRGHLPGVPPGRRRPRPTPTRSSPPRRRRSRDRAGLARGHVVPTCGSSR